MVFNWNDGKKSYEIERTTGMKRIVIWGTGNCLKEVITSVVNHNAEILAFVDSDEKKQGTMMEGKKIVSPLDIKEFNYDYLVLTSRLYKDEMLAQCVNLQIDLTKVIGFDQWNEMVITDVSKDMREAMQERQDNLIRVNKAKMISQEALKNAKVLCDREEALKYMPKGAVAAEIGVAYGDFSQKIMDIMQPDVLWAVDAYNGEKPGVGDIWGRTDIADSGLTHKEWYEQRFSHYIDEGKLKTMSGGSYDCLEKFPDGYFDYIYLDANHSYEFASRDTEVMTRKIKEGGILAFNDYTLYNFYTNPLSKEAYYGVPIAVNDMVTNSNSEVLFLCLERCLSMDIIIRYKK